MSETRTGGTATAKASELPTKNCDPLPGLIRSLLEKQQKEQSEREHAASKCNCNGSGE
ncbi:MAG: hypothetical protein AAGG48_19600 [Planctomycetota bacterium]